MYIPVRYRQRRSKRYQAMSWNCWIEGARQHSWAISKLTSHADQRLDIERQPQLWRSAQRARRTIRKRRDVSPRLRSCCWTCSTNDGKERCGLRAREVSGGDTLCRTGGLKAVATPTANSSVGGSTSGGGHPRGLHETDCGPNCIKKGGKDRRG